MNAVKESSYFFAKVVHVCKYIVGIAGVEKEER